MCTGNTALFLRVEMKLHEHVYRANVRQSERKERLGKKKSMQCVTESAARHAVSSHGNGLMPSGVNAVNNRNYVPNTIQFYNQSSYSNNNLAAQDYCYPSGGSFTLWSPMFLH